MEKKLNLVEKLKNCPKGTRLYSPLFGDVELFDVVTTERRYPITVKASDGTVYDFTERGTFMRSYDGECMLFPSKDNRDWDTWECNEKLPLPEFKPFDKVLVRVTDDNSWSCDFFSHTIGSTVIRYVTTCRNWWKQCIPYNELTKDLVGTTKESPYENKRIQ